MKKFGCALVALVFVASSTLAFADSLPSSKWAWALDDLIALGTSADTDPAGPPPSSTDTSWVNVLRTFIKAPGGKELALGVSLQCGIVTDTTVKSVGGTSDVSSARGRVRVRVKLTHPDGDTSFAEPANGIDANFDQSNPSTVPGLTYCDRVQRLEAKFAGLSCTAGLGGVVTCTNPEELRLLLKTLYATHFNFLAANLPLSGVYKIEVQARAQADVALGGSTLGAAKAEAFVGAGALSVETIRLVKDADGTPALQ